MQLSETRVRLKYDVKCSDLYLLVYFVVCQSKTLHLATRVGWPLLWEA